MTNYEVIAERLGISKQEMRRVLFWWIGPKWKETELTTDELVEKLEAFRRETGDKG